MEAEDDRKAKEILRLIDNAHVILNHANVSGFTPERHREWFSARSTAWTAHTLMTEAIRDAKTHGQSPIDHAYANGLPTTLLDLRDHPGLPGRNGARVVMLAYKARALLGAYPEGFEAWRDSPAGKEAYARFREE